MAEIKSKFVRGSGLEDLILQNEDNHYLFKFGRGEESPENPLPFLDRCHNKSFFLQLTGNGQIVGSLTLSEYVKGENIYYPDSQTMTIEQVSVHRDFRNRGLARALLISVFESVSRTEDVVLMMTHFEPDGRKYLAPILPRIHQQFANVSVMYKGAKSHITAEKPYELTEQCYSQLLPAVK